MTKVVHVVPALFAREDGVLGGAERYAYELARAMSARVATTLVTFGARPRTEPHGALTVRVVPVDWRVRGQAGNPFSRRLFAALRGADVIHCHQQHVVATTAAAAWARVTGRRVFVTDLGGGGWDLSAYVSTDHWFDGHLHISMFSRRVAGHDRRPDAHVIYGGVDTERFRPDPGVPREGRVLYVGRVLPHKGIHDLIRAVPRDLPLDIIGHVRDDRYLADLERLAAGRRVTFRHEVGDEELVDAYRRALCVVLPSVYRDFYGNTTRIPELLGQTLLEGMACGTPAVATDVASLPEVVEDGVTGFVVPAGRPEVLRERLERLAGEPDLVRRLGAAGRRHVLDRFTWDAVVARCLRVYRDA